jgi:hypothetical protein
MVMPDTWWDSGGGIKNCGAARKKAEFSWVLFCAGWLVSLLSWSVQCAALWLSVACNVNTLPAQENKDKVGDEVGDEVRVEVGVEVGVEVEGKKIDSEGEHEESVTKSSKKTSLDGNEGILTFATSVATRALQALNSSEMFAMDDLKYAWARRLGVHQQWFLFDNPVKRSSWFRIIGTDLKGKQYDLHQMMLQCLATTSGSSWLLPSSFDSETLIYRPVEEEDVSGDCMSWEQLYGSHRWRKFFQRLTDQRKRFASFQAPYVEGLDSMWQESGLSRKYSPLNKISCWGCWISLQSIGQELEQESSESETNSKCKTSCMVISRRCAWQVVLVKQKSDKTKK